MLEIGILGFIFLAIGYWAVLWMMGRREDVLHGEFVEDGQADEPAPAAVPQALIRPIFPERPARAAIAEPPAQAAVPAQPAFRPDRLELLLNSIKQDLSQLVQK